MSKRKDKRPYWYKRSNICYREKNVPLETKATRAILYLKMQHLTCRKKDGDVEKKKEKEDDTKEDENNNNNNNN